MKVRYIWTNSDVRVYGINSPSMSVSNVVLAPSTWNNPDYLLTKMGVDVFCLAATVTEIERELLPRIHHPNHRRLVESAMSHVPGLPFLVSRDGIYVQRLQHMPWREVNGRSVTVAPFWDIPETVIRRLDLLECIPAPKYTVSFPRKHPVGP